MLVQTLFKAGTPWVQTKYVVEAQLLSLLQTSPSMSFPQGYLPCPSMTRTSPHDLHCHRPLGLALFFFFYHPCDYSLVDDELCAGKCQLYLAHRWNPRTKSSMRSSLGVPYLSDYTEVFLLLQPVRK